MRFIGKNGKAYECFVDYKKNDNNAKEHQQLVDIFLPIMFQENEGRIEINVGRRISETKFVSWLSWTSKKFVVMPSMYNDCEPQMIIKGVDSLTANALINLTLIKDIHITTNEDENRCWHKICFNYNNEVDYEMHIVLDR